MAVYHFGPIARAIRRMRVDKDVMIDPRREAAKGAAGQSEIGSPIGHLISHLIVLLALAYTALWPEGR